MLRVTVSAAKEARMPVFRAGVGNGAPARVAMLAAANLTPDRAFPANAGPLPGFPKRSLAHKVVKLVIAEVAGHFGRKREWQITRAEVDAMPHCEEPFYVDASHELHEGHEFYSHGADWEVWEGQVTPGVSVPVTGSALYVGGKDTAADYASNWRGGIPVVMTVAVLGKSVTFGEGYGTQASVGEGSRVFVTEVARLCAKRMALKAALPDRPNWINTTMKVVRGVSDTVKDHFDIPAPINRLKLV